MNLTRFLILVDSKTAEMSREEMITLVHELARTLPEEGRLTFLEKLNSVSEINEAIDESDEQYAKDIKGSVQDIMGILSDINEGERCLDSEYNEEWDDWYNSDADEVFFSDPERIIPDIVKGISLMHQCMDMELYEEGCDLAELLSALEVEAAGDWCDYNGSPLGIRDLFDHELLIGSFEKVCGEALYLIYMGNNPEVRAEELFCAMSNFQCFSVSLEKIMQLGNHDLPGFQEFLPEWIAYLGNQNGWGVKELLQEAQSMVTDQAQILETARQFSDSHPELYMQILEQGLENADDTEMFKIGLEAMEKLSVTYVIRSEIALLTAEYACRIDAMPAAELCWLEAFRSDTSVVNYMRLYFQTVERKKYKEEIRQIYRKEHQRKNKERRDYRGYYDWNAKKENFLTENDYQIIRFFEQQFNSVIMEAMNMEKPLGWSATFMKQGLALFLMLLYPGKEMQAGMRTMLQLVVSAAGFGQNKYLQGTGVGAQMQEEKSAAEDMTMFWNLFCKWKEEVRISEGDSEAWIKVIEGQISKRVSGIMDANRRNYYGECAAYVAALGEVRESRGEKNAKQRILESYRAEYPRRRAFHQELRAYGMKR